MRNRLWAASAVAVLVLTGCSSSSSAAPPAQGGQQAAGQDELASPEPSETAVDGTPPVTVDQTICARPEIVSLAAEITGADAEAKDYVSVSGDGTWVFMQNCRVGASGLSFGVSLQPVDAKAFKTMRALAAGAKSVKAGDEAFLTKGFTLVGFAREGDLVVRLVLPPSAKATPAKIAPWLDAVLTAAQATGPAPLVAGESLCADGVAAVTDFLASTPVIQRGSSLSGLNCFWGGGGGSVTASSFGDSDGTAGTAKGMGESKVSGVGLRATWSDFGNQLSVEMAEGKAALVTMSKEKGAKDAAIEVYKALEKSLLEGVPQA